MGFFFFLLVTALLFIRPAELVPGMEEIPTYQLTIIPCMVFSLPVALAQLTQRSLIERPINLCVLGILLAIGMSLVTHLQLRLAYDSMTTFSKVAIYYLLLVANIDSLSRIRAFLAVVTGLIVIVAGLAVLQLHEVISLPGLEVIYDFEVDAATGQEFALPRICATGIFHDPNDLAMIVVFGMVLCAYWFTEPGLEILKPLWCSCLGFLGYTLAMTYSRGGLLALLAGIVVLFYSRYGFRKTIPLVAIVLPVMLVLFGGRQASFGGAIEGDTGQQRIQFWAEGIQLFKQAPLFGIGYDQFVEEVRHVAHNSFVHCYTELGLFGGTAFFGAFFYALDGLLRWCSRYSGDTPLPLVRLRPYLAASVTGFSTSMLSLSRSYVEPTYLMLGLASSYLSLAWPAEYAREQFISQRLAMRVLKWNFAFMAAIYIYVRVSARWG